MSVQDENFYDGRDRTQRHWEEDPRRDLAKRSEGIKHDQNKHRWGLVPWSAMRQVLAVLEHGAKKYGDYNWQKVEPFEARYREALGRHCIDFLEGKTTDEDSGLPVLAMIATNALFLLAGPKK